MSCREGQYDEQCTHARSLDVCFAENGRAVCRVFARGNSSACARLTRNTQTGSFAELMAGCLSRSQIPAMTRTVPAAAHAVNGSPNRMTAIRIVESGPIAPVCAVSEAPIRSIAIITIRTGAKVHAVAFNAESQRTCGATAMALKGLNAKNWTM